MTARGAGRVAAELLGELGPVGLRWSQAGHAVLTGPLCRLATDCERAYDVLGEAYDAEPEQHPAMLDIGQLQATDFLGSFPHLATFPVCLDPDEENLRVFRAAPMDSDGVRLSIHAAIREVLTPAACYHVYLHHQGERLTGPRVLTTRNTCFRREAHYQPLRRQWSFRMHELICLGTREEVTDFLGRTRAAVDRVLGELDLPVVWQAATDPFFEPARHPAYLAQRLRPTKYEACFDGLAIASANLHEDHFGAAFDLLRDGRPAVTGCVAFGLERWVYAITRRYGADPAGWPDVVAAVRRAVDGARAA
ncbi:MAG: hypothetical protein ACRDT6_17320 [Micromonosporaceae bacterium]